MRVFELAKILGMSSKQLLDLLTKLQIKASNHMARLDESAVAVVRAAAQPPAAPKKAAVKPVASAAKSAVSQKQAALVFPEKKPAPAKPAAPAKRDVTEYVKK